MKNLLKNQDGVTLIETIVATAIISIILVTIIGALLFGQKVIVFSDAKNNEAAQAQNLIDEIMTQLSGGTLPGDVNIQGAKKMGTTFDDSLKLTDPKQYYIMAVDTGGKTIGYNIYVREYYNNGDAQINYTAFAEKRNSGDSV